MKLKTRVVSILLFCCLLVAASILYFIVFFDDSQALRQFNETKKPLLIVPFTEVRKNTTNPLTLSAFMQRDVETKLKSLDFKKLFQKEENDKLRELIDSLKNDLKNITPNGVEQKSAWKIAASWVQAREVLPKKTPELGFVMNSMRTASIKFAGVSKKGTQLKLMVELDGNQKVLFKPKRYKRDEVISGPPYAGADRHTGEIAAFYLSKILDLRYVPIATSRIVNVPEEIKKVSSASLLATFLIKDNQSTDCFYGECYYCNEYDPVCPDQNGNLEGAIILFMPLHYELQKFRSPWQRTYREGVSASWETDQLYCDVVAKKLPLRPRLLDLIDVAIFDFLIGNADRHHYEVFKDVPNSMVIFLDNGKSFGSSFVDEITILAPLYQCCMIRNSTYQRLKLLISSSFQLSDALEQLLTFEPVEPVLTRAHLESLDRRLKTILAVILLCFDKKSIKDVIK